LHTLPVRRQLRLEPSAGFLYPLVKITANVGQPLRPTLIEPVAPFEPDGETNIIQLENAQVPRRLRQQAVENLEKLLASLGFAVESDQERLGRPATLGSPGSVENGLINGRTQRIARCQHVLGGHIRLARTVLEGTDLLNALPP